MEWPNKLQINAWTGAAPDNSTAVTAEATKWALRRRIAAVPTFLKPPVEPDFKEWRDPGVGWGLVLPWAGGLTDAQLGTADDAPEPIRELWRQRGHAPVFRYRPDWRYKDTHLTNYRSGKDVDLNGAPLGTGDDALPYYLLVYGAPTEIPWSFQYSLNANRCVGRLHLTGIKLENYVGKLLTDWNGAESTPNHTVVWAVDHGEGDITRLMRNAIAAKLHAEYAGDADIGANATFLDGTAAAVSSQDLIDALVAKKPGMVVTTSHGQTGPLADPATMLARLGLLVDANFATLDPAQLLAAWEPDGAVWYAHACCSAGSDAATIFDGVVDPGTPIDLVLKGVASLGAHVAPLPTELLGASKPARAFVGHVEPTFDWTLRSPATGQFLTTNLVKALYNGLFSNEPVGMAFAECYKKLAGLYTQYDNGFRAFNTGADNLDMLLATQLVARDIQSTVILGDPTAALPPL